MDLIRHFILNGNGQKWKKKKKISAMFKLCVCRKNWHVKSMVISLTPLLLYTVLTPSTMFNPLKSDD